MKKKQSAQQEAIKNARRVSREQQLASGIKPRAYTFADRKKVANRSTCRGRYTGGHDY